jgi:phospholipid transport system substrate-binding protein
MASVIEPMGQPPGRRLLPPRLLPPRLLPRRLLLGLAAAAVAWPGLAPGVGQAQVTSQAAEAQKIVSELYAGLRGIMSLGAGAPFQRKFDQLAPVIDRDFDLESILRTSVGLRWASLGEAAQNALFSVFRAFTVASYTANFGEDGGERFEVLPETRSSGNDLVVASRLIPSSGDPVRLDYVMHSGAMGWRIVDVLLNGSISRVAVQRSDFRSLLASGSATPLIDSLRQKVVALSDGAMRL